MLPTICEQKTQKSVNCVVCETREKTKKITNVQNRRFFVGSDGISREAQLSEIHGDEDFTVQDFTSFEIHKVIS